MLSLQDLGDVTLQAYLGAVPPAEHVDLYRQAVTFIEILQRRGAELASPAYPPYGIAFDVEKLLWELRVLHQALRRGLQGRPHRSPARATLTEEWQALAEDLAAEPRVLCHRDYHSRNLMLSAAISTSSISRTRGWGPTPTTWRRCCSTRTWT